MKELFLQYVIQLYQDVPISVYEGLLAILCVGVAIVFAVKGFISGWRLVADLLIAEYIVLLYCSTVIFRPVSEENNYDISPFWSYAAIQAGREDLMAENIMNTIVFVPVGLLLGCAIKSIIWWRALFIGGGLSISIEVMQLVFKRGFSEVDDVMHNTLGCMIGYGIYSLVRIGYERISESSLGVL